MFGQSLTVVGLIVEAVGVLMIFVWGPPQPNFEFESKTFITLEGGDDGGADEKRRHYRIMSGLALCLIFVGLLLQLWDAWKT
ncbi:MAG: hypothetical protein RO009_23530 [Pseudorhodoplanes sp.]|jgi:hypothetical protein|nr:hypothetical protein [Pseudorhodoplanes sp.]